ncbi:MAG: NAD(P)H-dependent oxidoreductase [Parachlamydiaceae bacterium]|nr:NAD(P)H-dependent oxidoreductase [Parachlamydiaceae bacterium]
MLKWLLIMCVAYSAGVTAETKVLAFAGSTRNDSINKKLVVEAANMARQKGATVTVVDFKDFQIPFYDEDLENESGMPAKAKELRNLMINSDVIFIASPEYNSSIPGILKNALDWTSRTEDGDASRDAFKGKKFAIMSSSPGGGGGARGLVHLRGIIEAAGGTVIKEQVVIPKGFEAFDQQGHLKNPQVKKELQALVDKALNK